MSVRHKAMLFILDGLGDRPSERLGGRTPLEAADTPNLDALANAGKGRRDPRQLRFDLSSLERRTGHEPLCSVEGRFRQNGAAHRSPVRCCTR